MNIQFILLLAALFLAGCGSGGGSSGGATDFNQLPQIDVRSEPIDQSGISDGGTDSNSADSSANDSTISIDIFLPPNPVDPQAPNDTEYMDLARFRMNPPAVGSFLLDEQGQLPLLPKYYPMYYRPEGCYLRLFGDQPKYYYLDLRSRVAAPYSTVLIEATVSFYSQPERENQRRPIFSSLGKLAPQWEWGLIRKGNVQKAYFRIRSGLGGWNEIISAPLMHIRQSLELESDPVFKLGVQWNYGKICFFMDGVLLECAQPISIQDSGELLDVSQLGLGWSDKDKFEGDVFSFSIQRQIFQ